MAFIPAHNPLMTTQEYLQLKVSSTLAMSAVGLSKQQCLQLLAGASGVGKTAQDAANNWAGTTGKTINDAMKFKMGVNTPTGVSPTDITKNDAAFYQFP